MKFLVVFYACAVVAFLGGSVLSDAYSDVWDEPDFSFQPCPFSYIHMFRSELEVKLMTEMEDCLTGGHDGLRNLTTLRGHQKYFTKFCDREVSARKTCITNVLSLAYRCGFQSDRIFYRMFAAELKTLLKIGCSEDGDHLARIYQGLGGPSNTSAIFSRCRHSSGIKFVMKDGTEGFRSNYRKLDTLKTCLLGRINHHNEILKAVVGTFLNQIKQNYLCFRRGRFLSYIVAKCSSLPNN